MTDQPGRFYEGPNHPAEESTGFALKPMTLADILDYAIRLLRMEWKAMAALVTVLMLPSLILGFVWQVFFVFSTSDIDEDFFVEGGGVADLFGGAGGIVSLVLYVVVQFVVAIVFTPLIFGAITRVVAGAYLGTRIAPKPAVKSMLPLWLTLVATSFLLALIVGSATLACLLPGLFVGVLFAVAIPVVAVEEASTSNALSRSFALMTRNYMGYLGKILVAILVGIVFYLFLYVVSLVAQVALTSLGSAVGSEEFGLILSIVAAQVFSLATAIVLMPFGAIVATLLYFDARVRYEGFDLQMMAAKVPLPPQSAQPPQDPPPSPPSGQDPPR